MQDSNWIKLPVIMVSFETNSHVAELIKAILRSQLVRNIYIYSKYFITLPVKSFFYRN